MFKSPESESRFERRDFSVDPESVLTQNGLSGFDGKGNSVSALVSYEMDSLNLFSLSLNGLSGKGTNTTNTGGIQQVDSRMIMIEYQRTLMIEGAWIFQPTINARLRRKVSC